MLGGKIRAIRQLKKMSQRELADKVNFSQSQISKLENGTRKITADEIRLIADALAIPVAALLNATYQEDHYE